MNYKAINKAKDCNGFQNWLNDYHQAQWDALQCRVQLLIALLTVFSGIIAIQSILPNDIPSTLCIHLVYLAPILLLLLGILAGDIALYDLLNMKSRLAKEIWKFLDEVLDQHGYQADKVVLDCPKRTKIFEIISYALFFLNIILFFVIKLFITL